MTDAAGKERSNAYIRIEHFAQDVLPLIDYLRFDLALEPREQVRAQGRLPKLLYRKRHAQPVQTACAAGHQQISVIPSSDVRFGQRKLIFPQICFYF